MANYTIIHGHGGKNKSKTYKSWDHMIQRCKNKNTANYHNYGGRGITVCERWLKFENFLEDMGEKPSPNHQIDRVNNDGNYCPENCKWSTKGEQIRNTRRNRIETYLGATKCRADWAKEYNIPRGVLRGRLDDLGWSLEKALNTSVRKRKIKDKQNE